MNELLKDFIAVETQHPIEQVAAQRGVSVTDMSASLAPMRNMKHEPAVQKALLLVKSGEALEITEQRLSEITKALAGVGSVIASTETASAVVNTKENVVLLPLNSSEVGYMRLSGMLSDPVGKDVLRYTLSKQLQSGAGRKKSTALTRTRYSSATQPFNVVQQLVRRKWLTKAEADVSHELRMAWEIHITEGGLPTEDDFACYDQPIVHAFMLLPKEVRQCLTLACLKDIGIEQVETDLKWPARSGKLVLRIGLRELQSKIT